MDRPRAVVKLKEEEKDLLAELVSHECYQVLKKIIEAEVSYAERQVIDHQMIPERFEELLIMKTRAEGYRLLASKVVTRLDEYRNRATMLK